MMMMDKKGISNIWAWTLGLIIGLLVLALLLYGLLGPTQENIMNIFKFM